MEFVQMTLTDWMEVKQRLKLELQGVKQSFVRIGYLLRKIDDQKAYESDGYKSIAEFAKAEYGLEASTVSRFMSINREYSIDGYSEHLREEYLDMGRSQLEEMLKLPDKDREMIQPEASREDIRELKRFNKSEPAAGVADDIQKLIEKFYEDNPGILNELFGGEEKTTEQYIELVNPSGNRSFKKGLFFLMMYEENIKIKKFGADPQTMSWSEFFEITKAIFGEAADGPNTWNNYFGNSQDEKEEHIPQENEPSKRESEENPQKSTKEEAEKTQNKPDEKEEIPKQKKKEHPETEEDSSITNPVGRVIESIERGCFERAIEQEKTPIAPAQKTEKTLGKIGVSEASEELPGQMEIVKDFPEYCPGEVVEEETVMNSPIMTRKDYIDTLTAYGMAVYLSEEYKEHSLKVSSLAYPAELEKWLLEEVDVNGKTIGD